MAPDRKRRRAAGEDMMILKFSAVLLATALGFGMTAASAQSPQAKRQMDDRRPYYGPNGPNQVYQQGPHTRIYVTRRSWLDAGTEVLPGDRKFQDYAFPPTQSFGQQNNNRPLDRQPLNPPSDMGGYPTGFPLY
jgi:hypothetical protein